MVGANGAPVACCERTWDSVVVLAEPKAVFGWVLRKGGRQGVAVGWLGASHLGQR
jgi:hypothetical protein